MSARENDPQIFYSLPGERKRGKNTFVFKNSLANGHSFRARELESMKREKEREKERPTYPGANQLCFLPPRCCSFD